MRRSALSLLLLGAVTGAVFASASSGAHRLKSCTEVERIVPPFVYTRYCGPAKADLTVAGTRYSFSGGKCTTAVKQGKRQFDVAIGYQKRHFVDFAKTSGRFLDVGIRPYRGDGRYRVDGVFGPGDVWVVTKRVWSSARQAGFITLTDNGTRGRISVVLYTGEPPNSSNWITTRATGSFTCT